MRECCNDECGWIGEADRMCGAVGPLCPDCGEVTELVSTAREYQPEKDDVPGSGPVSAVGNLRIAIEEALASMECGMIGGAVAILQDALSRNLPAETP